MPKMNLLNQQEGNKRTDLTQKLRCFADLYIAGLLVFAGIAFALVGSANAQTVTGEQIAGILIGQNAVPQITNYRTGDIVRESIIEIKGSSDNDTFVDIYVDDVLDGTIFTVNGDAGKGIFSGNLNLQLAKGAHVIYAVARSANKVASQRSEEVIITYTVEEALSPIPSVMEEKEAKSEVEEGRAKEDSAAVVIPPLLRRPIDKSNVKTLLPVIDGVVKTNHTVALYIDDSLDGTIPLKESKSGVTGFAYKVRKEIAPGWHEVFAYSFNADSARSRKSEPLRFYVERPSIAPTVLATAQKGSSHYVTGLAASNSRVKIFVRGKEDGEIAVKSHPSGVASFSYKIASSMKPGMYDISAQAFDLSGKPSRISFGKPVVVKQPAPKSRAVVAKAEIPAAKPAFENGIGGPTPEEAKEAELKGRIVADDEEKNGSEKKAEDEKKSLAQAETDKKEPQPKGGEDIEDETKSEPGAKGDASQGKEKVEKAKEGKIEEDQVKDEAKTDEGEEYEEAEYAAGGAVNAPLVIGIIILLGLIISFIVWYVMQRREMVNEGIKKLFREGDEREDWEDEGGAFESRVENEEDVQGHVEEALYAHKEDAKKDSGHAVKTPGEDKSAKEKTPPQTRTEKKQEDPMDKKEVKSGDDMTLPSPPPDL